MGNAASAGPWPAPCARTLILVMVLGSACRRAPAPAVRDAEEQTTGAKTVEGGALAEGPDGGLLPTGDTAPARITSTTTDPAPLAPEEAGGCPKTTDDTIGLMVSPIKASVGSPVRVVAATLANTERLAIRIDSGKNPAVEASTTFRDGIPAMTVVRFVPKQPGDYRVVVGRGGNGLRCTTVHVARWPPPKTPREALTDGIWPVTRNWNGTEEALYSAWIREMFSAPRGDELAFARLDQVTANPQRNVLFDHFGWGEDSSPRDGLSLKPDCADTPYFLRAYFSWKRSLPFAYHHCDSGSPPKCDKVHTVLEAPDLPTKMPEKWNELTQVRRYFLRSVQEVHTGNGRVPFEDEENDFYGLELTRRALRPGSIFADPYGHVMVVAEFLDGAGALPGILYAIDGQPDGSITRKRFWEGNFLWNPDPKLGGSGFKAFRPITLKTEEETRVIEYLTDARIAKSREYADGSRRQAKLDANQFYDTMDRLITPGTRDPVLAQEEMVRALWEAAKVRVTSVNNADPYFASHPGDVIAMPDGAEIFETAGPWEDFSTPSRDLRLLIAMDVVNHFDEKVSRHPEAFGVSGGPTLEALTQKLSSERKRLLDSAELAFTYKRSNGAACTLTLSELMSRATALEAAYNPNDCPEYRWGAPTGSDEASSCNRRAPEDQQKVMESHRVWFHERKRPGR